MTLLYGGAVRFRLIVIVTPLIALAVLISLVITVAGQSEREQGCERCCRALTKSQTRAERLRRAVRHYSWRVVVAGFHRGRRKRRWGRSSRTRTRCATTDRRTRRRRQRNRGHEWTSW